MVNKFLKYLKIYFLQNLFDLIYLRRNKKLIYFLFCFFLKKNKFILK